MLPAVFVPLKSLIAFFMLFFKNIFHHSMKSKKSYVVQKLISTFSLFLICNRKIQKMPGMMEMTICLWWQTSNLTLKTFTVQLCRWDFQWVTRIEMHTKKFVGILSVNCLLARCRQYCLAKPLSFKVLQQRPFGLWLMYFYFYAYEIFLFR